MKKFVRKILDKFGLSSLYVVADARDNSISFSRRLFRHLQRHARTDKAVVMTFTVNDKQETRYAFMADPDIDKPTQLASIQVNAKYHTVGFECLVPTVNRIFYDYKLPLGVPIKLTTSVHTTPQGAYYYIIERPKTIPLCQK